MKDLAKKSTNALADPQVKPVVDFLKSMGLPSDNIIAESDQRGIITNNLEDYVRDLPIEVKRDARYLSKFVIGAATGLFDYALNAIWNEVVLDLRKKAIAYGVDIFFDAAVGGKRREFFKDENDLGSLKDSVLLDTCKKLELIAPTTYKKLAHILEMRNDIGISHPTNYTINAYELLGWLETCVRDVLNDQPTEAAVQVKAFIANLRKAATPIDQPQLASIQGRISELASHHVASILRTSFGVFVSSGTDPQIRKNIALIAPTLWEHCDDGPKYQLGILLEGYNNNLFTEKYELGGQFFDAVSGNSFRSESERMVKIDALLDDLLAKHNEWDNFHHEPPVANDLASYIQDQNDILPNNVAKLVKIILMCRIGRGVDYCDGISQRARPFYDHMLGQLGDKYAPHILIALTTTEIQMKLEKSICRKHARQALEVVRQSIVVDRLTECMDYLIERIEGTGRCVLDTEFKKLSSGYLKWK